MKKQVRRPECSHMEVLQDFLSRPLKVICMVIA